MSLDTTVGGASSDSYASLTEFNTYQDSRIPALAWLATATDAQKEAALREACRVIDACFDWLGVAVDATQVLTWPRRGLVNRNGFSIPTTFIPNELKNAQCELAGQLGAGDRLSDNDPLRKGISSIKAGSVGITFKDTNESTIDAVDMIIRRQGSEFNYVSSAIPDEVRRLLVASWFKQPSMKRPVLFGAM